MKKFISDNLAKVLFFAVPAAIVVITIVAVINSSSMYY